MKPQKVKVTRVVDRIKKQKKFRRYYPKSEQLLGSGMSFLA